MNQPTLFPDIEADTEPEPDTAPTPAPEPPPAAVAVLTAPRTDISEARRRYLEAKPLYEALSRIAEATGRPDR